MENKYYTPSIEEFFVGFEYEELEFLPVKDPHFGIKITKNIFVEHIWKTGYSNWQFLDNLKDGKIRVKYLDASDIEELGFTVVKTKGNSFEAVKKFTFTYDNYPSEGEYNIIVSGDKYCVIKLKDIGETTLFRGEIKNKNVLKQVLKMLDIK